MLFPFFLTAIDSLGTLHLALGLVGVDLATASMWAVKKSNKNDFDIERHYNHLSNKHLSKLLFILMIAYKVILSSSGCREKNKTMIVAVVWF